MQLKSCITCADYMGYWFMGLRGRPRLTSIIMDFQKAVTSLTAASSITVNVLLKCHHQFLSRVKIQRTVRVVKESE